MGADTSIIEQGRNAISNQLTNLATSSAISTLRELVGNTPHSREGYEALNGKGDVNSVPALKLIRNFSGMVDTQSVYDASELIRISSYLKTVPEEDRKLYAKDGLARTADAIKTIDELLQVQKEYGALKPESKYFLNSTELVKLRDQFAGQLKTATDAMKAGDFVTPASLAAATPIMTNGNYIDEVRYYGAKAVADGRKLIASISSGKKLSWIEGSELVHSFSDNSYASVTGKEMQIQQANAGAAIAVGAEVIVARFAATAAGIALAQHVAKEYPAIASAYKKLSGSQAAEDLAAQHAARRQLLPDIRTLRMTAEAGARPTTMVTPITAPLPAALPGTPISAPHVGHTFTTPAAAPITVGTTATLPVSLPSSTLVRPAVRPDIPTAMMRERDTASTTPADKGKDAADVVYEELVGQKGVVKGLTKDHVNAAVAGAIAVATGSSIEEAKAVAEEAKSGGAVEAVRRLIKGKKITVKDIDALDGKGVLEDSVVQTIKGLKKDLKPQAIKDAIANAADETADFASKLTRDIRPGGKNLVQIGREILEVVSDGSTRFSEKIAINYLKQITTSNIKKIGILVGPSAIGAFVGYEWDKTQIEAKTVGNIRDGYQKITKEEETEPMAAAELLEQHLNEADNAGTLDVNTKSNIGALEATKIEGQAEADRTAITNKAIEDAQLARKQAEALQEVMRKRSEGVSPKPNQPRTNVDPFSGIGAGKTTTPAPGQPAASTDPFANIGKGKN